MTSPITDTLLEHPAIRHGFFTREGGVSTGIFASLNVGLGSSDDAGNVKENRARVAAYFDAPTERLLTCYQVHSPDVVTLGLKALGGDKQEALARVRGGLAQTQQTTQDDVRPTADAMVTDIPSLVLGILTADCAPVLFADPAMGVIGAAHAGWKGALGGVLENTITAMETLGARRASMRVVIGPCIGPNSYEIGPEFEARFIEENEAYERFFAENDNGKRCFDLPAFVRGRLALAGVDAHWCDHDTLGDTDRFFSYRRKTLQGEQDYGRQVSAIMLA